MRQSCSIEQRESAVECETYVVSKKLSQAKGIRRKSLEDLQITFQAAHIVFL
jgi:hypothetical protein